jgi:DNA-binding transcriptional MerR regulator
MDLKIGTLARRTGTTVPTIRYYEAIGLLPRPNRRGGGQRSYGEDDVKRLTFVRQCRDFGFPIEQIRTLALLMQDRDRSCTEARDLAQQHLATVKAKLVELRALERAIGEFVQTCDNACAGGPGPDCVVLQELTEPAAAPPASCRYGART